MNDKYNKSLIPYAKRLRKTMTKEERRLWYTFLNKYPIKFRRQEVFEKYIADFYCPSAKLIIELDGSQHFEEKGLAYDEQRTEYLKKYEVTVIRIANNYVNNKFRDVCNFIDYCVKQNLK